MAICDEFGQRFGDQNYFTTVMREFTRADHTGERYSGKDESHVHEWLSRSLFNKGMILGKLDKPDAAIAIYEEIERCFGQDENPGIRIWSAKALLNKGMIFGKLDKPDAAIAVYEEIERRFAQDEDSDVRKLTAEARKLAEEQGRCAEDSTGRD
jgi:TolA-binding protein